jgi:glycosyltransferase involved in cell wall biosynthesis
VLPEVAQSAVESFASQYRTAERRPVIGMAARLASEKGVEVLIEALPRILERYPRAQVLYAGQYQNVLGEEAYAQRLAPALAELQSQGHWSFLGVLDPAAMAGFFPNLDVFVVPSLNSTEAFGLVQIEAMINGVPCVASDLPGVRQPIHTTGMGMVTPIGNSSALAEAILTILDQPQRFQGDPQAIRERYLPDSIAQEYEALFSSLLVGKSRT